MQIEKKKIAIIGASYLQLPLIKKAKDMGLETHVFAWAANDVGEKEADFFYPISIVEKDDILEECKKIEIDGICSIASDLAMKTVNYVAQKMGLISNSIECTNYSTDKHLMRECFERNGDPSPKSMLIDINSIDLSNFLFPLIIKPTDRSGSRGITKIYDKSELSKAVELAVLESFDKRVLIEEYVEGTEYSVECISWCGKHTHLQTTLKYTTGSPNFIETGHIEPAPISQELNEKIKEVVFHALTSLGIEYGASHSEIKIDKDNNIKLIEIGGRMGGDLIGSHMVKLSTGYDYVENVIKISLGLKPDDYIGKSTNNVAVRFIFNKNDYDEIENIKYNKNITIVDENIDNDLDVPVKDSSNRHGYCLFMSDDINEIYKYMPK